MFADVWLVAFPLNVMIILFVQLNVNIPVSPVGILLIVRYPLLTTVGLNDPVESVAIIFPVMLPLLVHEFS